MALRHSLLYGGVCVGIAATYSFLISSPVRDRQPVQTSASIVASVIILPAAPVITEVVLGATNSNYSIITATLTGSGFGSGGSSPLILLERSGQSPITMSIIGTPSTESITGTFALSGAESGSWILVAKNVIDAGTSTGTRVPVELPLTAQQRIVLVGSAKDFNPVSVESVRTVTGAGGQSLRLVSPLNFISSTGATPTIEMNILSKNNDFIGSGKPIIPTGGISGDAELVGDVYSIDLRREDTPIHTLLEPVRMTFLYTGANIQSVFPVSYDESDRVWRVMDGRSIDSSAHSIIVDASHFSVFSLAENAVVVSAGGGSSGSGWSRGSVSVTPRVTTGVFLPAAPLAYTATTATPPSRSAQMINVPVGRLVLFTRGAAVSKLQRLLIAHASRLGPKTKALSVAGATGYFGKTTEGAVAEFQALLARGAGVSARALLRAMVRKEGIGSFGPLTRAAALEFMRL